MEESAETWPSGPHADSRHADASSELPHAPLRGDLRSSQGMFCSSTCMRDTGPAAASATDLSESRKEIPLSEQDTGSIASLDKSAAPFVPVLFGFAWWPQEASPILVRTLTRDDFALISITGASDVGREGNVGSPAVFSAGHARQGQELAFAWSVRMLGDIRSFGAFVKFGERPWKKLKDADKAAQNAEWSDDCKVTAEVK